MFTGIVQSCCEVVALKSLTGLIELSIQLPSHLRDNIVTGASIAINGVCLTVTTFDKASGVVNFDAMQETLDLTNLGKLSVGNQVNVERSATFSKEIGGHCVSGHIDGKAYVEDIETTENNKKIYFSFPESFNKYLFYKGFVALNGCSLTIAEKDDQQHRIAVCYIPETLQVTNHGLLNIGDSVNLEIDRQTQAVVDSVERIMAAKGFS